MGGFTLLELMVVLVIMGLLSAVVAPQIMNMFSGAKTDAAALQVDTLTTALHYYQIDTGSYPTPEQGLEVLWKAPPDVARWRGPYIRKHEHLLDPWGRPFRYRVPGQRGPFDIYSFGADDREGGEGENADVGLSKAP
ncbi:MULTISPECIES: type II secretion system major pseudopilin GspG [unclassified Methylocaldum]|jgi:general secretion pathway protein G|uniref:type II secretion system major pseudopilin GspG n=1 Tax=unclassified Methylocaldum TaxID=2622260 RepID=UPI00197B48CD|nr:type II secretion system major pseudopilin GspG [Methylocaldum sp. RMAD-M]MBP1152667.1 general secretion pathway protein G [Methylocaldum sp. RMAD-M]